MEKKPYIETPSTPLQGNDSTTGALRRALGVEDRPDSQFPDKPSTKRVWKFPAQRKIAYRHRKLFASGVVPNPSELSHLPHGYKNGCICEKCMVEHGWFEDVVDGAENISASTAQGAQIRNEKINSAGSSASAADIVKELVGEDDADFISDLIDEETAGIILDSFREAGRHLYIGKGLPPDMLKVWDKDKNEVAILGRAGKKAWDKYGKLPNFKYKELMIVGFLVAKSVGLRVWATSQLIEASKLKN